MKQGPAPVFLEKRSYRARRVTDAVRVLPVIGVLLWMVPLLWPVPELAASASGEQAEGTSMSQALRYVFGVWAVLIVLSLGLWATARRYRVGSPGDPDSPSDQDNPG